MSKTPAEFLQSIAPVVTLDDLKSLVRGDDAMVSDPRAAAFGNKHV